VTYAADYLRWLMQ